VLARARIPAAVFVVSALVYSLMLGDRALAPSPDNHYVHLAHSFLEGELGVVGNQPPGTNDWACYDTVEHDQCPANQYSFPASQRERYRWYVSFPPLPALVMVPFVAAFGLGVPDRLIWAILAGFGPALLFVLLRHLREIGMSTRSERDDLVLSALFAFGTVYFFTAVQGTVWFAAHVVAVPLLALHVMWALGARRPVLAGLMLGLAFMTRPTTAFLVPFFLIEAMRAARPDDAPVPVAEHVWVKRVIVWIRGVKWQPVARSVAHFGAPILIIGAIAMWMNHARFEDPFEFGHTYLQIRWRPRIEKWGLFNFHYFAKNLAVFVAALPWLSATAPFVTISRHGLALWVTTPNLLLTAWPKRVTHTLVALYVATFVVLLLNLCYQNSGWVQFGYRFALDYMIPLFVLLALGGRRFGPGFYLMMAFAIAVNTFGAATFDRSAEYYDQDSTQNVIFQPD
jgi:hypothetical protein